MPVKDHRRVRRGLHRAVTPRRTSSISPPQKVAESRKRRSRGWSAHSFEAEEPRVLFELTAVRPCETTALYYAPINSLLLHTSYVSFMRCCDEVS